MESSINHTIDGTYVREWLILGPFFPDDLDEDFLTDAGGEANIDPEEGGTVTTAGGKILTWKRYKSEDDVVSLLDAVLSSKDQEHATAYAFCVLQSEIAGKGLIGMRNDDGIAIWMNGKRVYTYPTVRDMSFDSDNFEVDLEEGSNRCLVKVSHIWGDWGFALRVVPPNRATISGTISDEEGEPVPWVDVRLEQNGKWVANALTNVSGNYRLDIYPVRGPYDLSATSGDLGDWQLGMQLSEGERRELNFTLKNAVSIEGRLLMLDDATPHVAVPVQILSDGEVIATRLSDDRGQYQFVNLRPAQYQVRCQVLGGHVYFGEEKAGEPESQRARKPESRKADKPMSLQIEVGRTHRDIDFCFPPFKKGTWRHYTVIDGLASIHVHDIQQDPDGALWFASCSQNVSDIGYGVSRYDGKEFTVFTTEDGLASDRVWTIYSSPEGVMWFGTRDGGVSRYDGREFINFTTKDGLVSNDVWDIHGTPDGIMWFGTYGGGVSRYDGKEFVNFTTEDGLPSNTMISIHQDPDGTMWFGTDGSGVSRYDGKEFANFTTEDGLVSDAPIAMHRDTDGILWFGTGYPGGGISRYDGKKFVNLTTKDGLPHNRVWDIHCDPDGVMWFATDYGVSRYDGKGFVNFTKADGLLDHRMQAIQRDQDGVLWFTTGMGGVSRYDDKSFVTFTTRDGLPDNFVQAIHVDPDGAMWVGAGLGLARYDKSSIGHRAPVTFDPEDGFIPSLVSAIHCAPDGTLWLGTGGIEEPARGVFRYKADDEEDLSPRFVNFTTEDGLADNRIWNVCSGADGAVWFGTNGGGVSRYDGKEFARFSTEDGLAGNHVFAIFSDPDGAIWFGTESGVSRYDGKEFTNLTAANGLVSDVVFAIHRDLDGLLWLGTTNGLSRYDGEEFVSFTTKDGLAHNWAYAIHCDPDGVMWFATWGGGVSGYDGVAWTSLDTRDGLGDNRVFSIEPDANGDLWFATWNGLTRYRRSRTRPRAYIVSVTTDRTYRELSDIPAITPGRRVTVEYNAIDFKTLPEKRQYRCRIREIDSDWRKPTRSASFDCVFHNPGTYTFEVQAIDRDLNYSEPATVELEVVADPQKQHIAQLESDLEKRNRDLEQANAELQRLSNFKSELLSMVSHELRTPLTSIDGFTRLIHERFLTDDLIAKCNEETRPTIQRVKDRIAIVQENTSRLARLINDLLDFSRIERGRELEMHFARIELSYVIETVIATYQGAAMEKGLTLKYGGEVPLNAEELMVSGDADRLTQVLNNLVSNSVKFTPEGGNITIGTRKEGGKIELSVQDTGVGISEAQLSNIFEPFEQAGGTDAKKSGTGLGLAIVKYIIDRHDGTVRVESEEDAGSTFIITLSEYVKPEASKRQGIQRILIVDDDYDILRLLEEGLSEYPNTHIITTTNSKSAFQILEKQQCDVMIADVRMPGDISGLELAAQVREKYPGLKVFVMTNTPEEKERVIRTEADWIDKAIPDLIHYIAKKIERGQEDDQ